MKVYDVSVQRVEYTEHVFQVTAKSQREAKSKAMEAASDFNFNDCLSWNEEKQVTGIELNHTATIRAE